MSQDTPESGARHRTFWGRAESFRHAANGIGFMLRTQRNAWIHATVTLAVVALGLLLRVSTAEWCWLILAMASVWTAESFNTALELITDLASPETREAAGRAKDVAAGAVLLCSVGAAAIGLVILLPPLGRLLAGG